MRHPRPLSDQRATALLSQLGKWADRRPKPGQPDVTGQSSASQEDSAQLFCDAYLLWSKKLYQIALVRTSDAHEAEDIVAETFKRAWEKPLELQRAESSAAWLQGIMRHVILDHHRSRKKRQHRLDQWDVAAEPCNGNAPYSAEVLAALKQALRGLPTLYADVLEAHYINHEHLRSIATRAKVPLNTVKWWLWEGRRRLRSNKRLLEAYTQDRQSKT